MSWSYWSLVAYLNETRIFHVAMKRGSLTDTFMFHYLWIVLLTKGIWKLIEIHQCLKRYCLPLDESFPLRAMPKVSSLLQTILGSGRPLALQVSVASPPSSIVTSDEVSLSTMSGGTETRRNIHMSQFGQIK